MDQVDKILQQWHRERPDLDVSAMGILGRCTRLTMHISRKMEKNFANFGLNSASFDVLATLRRSGSPYQLSPGRLIAAMMVTSGTMTNRIDQLEKAGFVRRITNPSDKRSVIISLTDEGFSVIDEAVETHVKLQAELVSGLTTKDAATLNKILTRFLANFERD